MLTGLEHNLWLFTSLVVVVSFIVFVVLLQATGGITFYAVGGDNERIVQAGANFEKWSRPSGMHKFSNGKARMKEVSVLGLVLAQRVLGDKESDHPLVALCLFTNALSGILVFAIAQNYWGTGVGLVVFGLYLTSVWPTLIAFWGGVVSVSQFFCLLSIWLFQVSESAPDAYRWILYLMGGAATAAMLFSSASSRKYIIMCGAAFLWSTRDLIDSPWHLFSAAKGPYSWLDISIMSSAFLILLGVGCIHLLRRRLFSQVDWTWLPQSLLRRIYFSADPAFNEKRRIAFLKMLYLTEKIGFRISGGLLVLLALSDSISFWSAWGVVLLGGVAVTLVLTYPAIIENLAGYYTYSQYGTSTWRSRFYNYRDFFSQIGRPIDENMRGAGLIWVVRYFSRIMPVHMVYAYLCILLLVIALSLEENSWLTIGISVGAIVLGLSPTLIGELSGGVQVGRAYFPSLLGLLFIVGYASTRIMWQLPTGSFMYWLVSTAAIMMSAVWGIRVIKLDIFPARMAATKLMRTLCHLKINSFSTYNTIYNDSFLKVLPARFLQNFQIEWIDRLDKAKTDYVVVPGTSKKSITMSDYPIAQQPDNGYESDPILKQLIENHEIERYAVASFETFGTSRFWVHESEVTSYRDLILREISKQDRWRGRAWILDAAKVRRELLATHSPSRINAV